MLVSVWCSKKLITGPRMLQEYACTLSSYLHTGHETYHNGPETDQNQANIDSIVLVLIIDSE